LRIHGHRADGSHGMIHVMLRGVTIFAAAAPGHALAIEHQLLGIAERQALLSRKLLGARRDEHHVLARFHHFARQANRIANSLHSGNCSGLQRRPVHHDRIQLDTAIEIQMRSDARVERGIVFEHDDRGLNRVKRRSSAREHAPTRFESAAATLAAVFDRTVRDIPRAAVNDESWFQEGFGEPTTRPQTEEA